MKINCALILELRAARPWSQEELSIAAGLSLRTIQRVEKDGVASLQSRKAIAAALDIDVSDLDYQEPPTMKKYEYKTIDMPFKWGVFKQGTPDIERLLNAEGNSGWRL